MNEFVIKLLNLQKKNIMLLSNEIFALENLLEYKGYFNNIIVVLSGNLNKEQKENIIKNSPNKDVIKYINELEYPTLIKPKDSVIILFGYRSGDKCLLTKNSYRSLEIYKNFLGDKILTRGTVTGSMVTPREIYMEALRRHAVSLILIHNHPSGDPTPSPDDVQITTRIYQAGELIGIHLLDHIVIGDQKYCSFREEGLWEECVE